MWNKFKVNHNVTIGKPVASYCCLYCRFKHISYRFWAYTFLLGRVRSSRPDVLFEKGTPFFREHLWWLLLKGKNKFSLSDSDRRKVHTRLNLTRSWMMALNGRRNLMFYVWYFRFVHFRLTFSQTFSSRFIYNNFLKLFISKWNKHKINKFNLSSFEDFTVHQQLTLLLFFILPFWNIFTQFAK